MQRPEHGYLCIYRKLDARVPKQSKTKQWRMLKVTFQQLLAWLITLQVLKWVGGQLQLHANSPKCCCLTHSSVQVCKLGCSQIFTRLDICQKTEKKNKFTGNCCVDCKSNWFQFSGYMYDEGSNFKGAIYATTTRHIPLGFHSEDTFLSDGNDWHLHFETSQESLFTAKHNKTKPNKQGKCKLKLCDLPLCTQSGRWHAFHILFERVPTSPNVDDRTHGGPKWEAGFYMGQRQEDYRGQINGGSREAGILTWIASRRTHGATCI